MANSDTACSGVILAGGLSKRFSGINKAFLEVAGKRVIDHIFGVFSTVFEDILIVTNEPTRYLEFDATIVSDVYSVRSSLTGVHAGLFYARTPFVFVAACDIPFLKESLVRTILDYIESNAGVVIPETEDGIEPMCAVYAKICLPVMERHIKSEEFKIRQIFKSTRVKKVPENALRQADPELQSFFNINTPDDLKRAESWRGPADAH
jgi:molybdopterin-guanine dinucleotide biosynthesis protein A